MSMRATGWDGPDRVEKRQFAPPDAVMLGALLALCLSALLSCKLFKSEEDPETRPLPVPVSAPSPVATPAPPPKPASPPPQAAEPASAPEPKPGETAPNKPPSTPAPGTTAAPPQSANDAGTESPPAAAEAGAPPSVTLPAASQACLNGCNAALQRCLARLDGGLPTLEIVQACQSEAQACQSGCASAP